MITRMAHVMLYVLDLDEAKSFYTDVLGFTVRADVVIDGFRWLTVSPPGQELEIALMRPEANPIYDESTAAVVRDLVTRGAMGAGVFATDDCHATYAQLKARGVEFLSQPQERPYGIEATFKDNSGNWFSLTQQH